MSGEPAVLEMRWFVGNAVAGVVVTVRTDEVLVCVGGTVAAQRITALTLDKNV